MSDHRQREAIASLLLDHINKSDVLNVESCLKQVHDNCQWRDIVRHEFPIQELMSDNLRYDLTIPRLLAYEINTLSPFHYAALRGLNEILVNFIDHDIPVDVALSVGTTGLHLASFGGKVDCVKMLLDVYQVDINKQDRYGWGALHYASTEGNYDVVKVLVDSGATVSLRDQDGTSAAFRAQVNGYTDIVELLCANEPNLLQVDTAYSATKPTSPDGLYSQVWINKPPVNVEKETEKARSVTLDRPGSGKPAIQPKPTHMKAKLRKFDTLPRNFKENRTSSIRRLIQRELENIEGDESGYMRPSDGLPGIDDEEMVLAGIGANTLKGVIREEIGKYTKRLLSKSSSSSVSDPDPILEEFPDDLGPAPRPPRRNEYEDIYETVKLLPPKTRSASLNHGDGTSALTSIFAPPLPPRNLPNVLELFDEEEDITTALKLKRTTIISATDSTALSECINRIAKVIGSDWRKLAFSLPMNTNLSKIQERMDIIEKRHPGNHNKQAAVALAEWRINKGESADLDDLTIALRKCGLRSLIDEVDRVTQEFTA